MSEIPRQFPPAKHPARGVIHFGGSDARTDNRDSGQLRFQDSLIQPSSFARRLSDVHSSRAIRTITGEYNTKIAHHEPAPGNARERRPTVNNRGTRSRS